MPVGQFRSAFVAGCFAALLVGCSTPPPQGTVTGTVKLDGKPLPTGTIAFVSAAGRPPETTTITDGAFSLTLSPGEKRVEIRALRPKKGPVSTSTIRPEDPNENYIPARYNSTTKLTATVTAGSQAPLAFDLTLP